MGQVLNRTEASRLFGVNVSTIDAWLREGMPFVEKPAKKGQSGWKIDAAEILEWHRKKEHEKTLVEGASEGQTIDTAGLRREIAMADLRELERDEKRGLLIPIDEAERAWVSVAHTVRERLLGLPDRLAEILAALTDAKQVRERLDKEVRACLTEMPEAMHGGSKAA